MFTLKILVGGKQVVYDHGWNYDKLRGFLPEFQGLLPSLQRFGRVTLIVCCDGVEHLLGVWRQS
jgi:hypothetical protein